MLNSHCVVHVHMTMITPASTSLHVSNQLRQFEKPSQSVLVEIVAVVTEATFP